MRTFSPFLPRLKASAARCFVKHSIRKDYDLVTVDSAPFTFRIRVEEFTRKFNVAQEKDAEIRHILTTVYAALEDKGYNPINQIVGYILSEDPTYITNHNSARTLIRKLDRDELLQALVRSYLGK